VVCGNPLSNHLTIGSSFLWSSLKLALLLLTLILALHSRFFLIPKLSEENLNFLALHIVAVTTLAVLFVIFGAGIRLGGGLDLGLDH
jgi:hypothetical protein